MALEVKEISKQYGSFTALHPLSFTLNEPGVYALLGTNGAGKTTAIRVQDKRTAYIFCKTQGNAEIRYRKVTEVLVCKA